jgi:2-phospho-L-lactate guanylyltransferase (CobY/MobA/RfbA family)
MVVDVETVATQFELSYHFVSIRDKARTAGEEHEVLRRENTKGLDLVEDLVGMFVHGSGDKK